MKKQLLFGIMISTFLLSGCGETVSDMPLVVTVSDSSVDIPQEETMSVSSDSSISTELPSETIAETSSIIPYEIQVSFQHFKEYRTLRGQRRLAGYCIAPEIAVNADFPDISDRLNTISEHYVSEMSENVSIYADTFLQNHSGTYYNASEDPYYNSYSVRTVRADSLVTSLLIRSESHTGSRHPYSYYTALNLDTMTGEDILFSDLVSSEQTDSFVRLMTNALYEKYGAEPFTSRQAVFNQLSYLIHQDALIFTIGIDGLHFHFAPYELSGYSSGFLSLFFPYEKYTEYISDRYTDIPCNYVVALPDETENYAVPATDTVLHLNSSYDIAAGEYTLSLSIDDGDILTSTLYGTSFIPYLVRQNGKLYLYLHSLINDTMRVLSVFDLNDDVPSYVITYPCYFYDTPSDPDHLRIGSTSSLLAEYTIYGNGCISDGGQLSLRDETYTYAPKNGAPVSVTLLQDLDVALFADPEHPEDNHRSQLPSGTVLYLARTDNVSYIEFQEPVSECFFRIYPNINGSEQTLYGADLRTIFSVNPN